MSTSAYQSFAGLAKFLLFKISLHSLKLLRIYIFEGRKIHFISLHIRSMWETIYDAWACWSGWNFGSNPTEYPYSVVNWYRIPPTPRWKLSESPNPSVPEYPPQNENCQSPNPSVPEYPPHENCQRVNIQVSQNTPPKWKLSESPNPSVPEHPPNENCQSPNPSVPEYPPKMKIVRESKSEFRVSQNTPPNENCQSPNLSVPESPPKWKLSESKSECPRIPPPQNRENFRFQTSE